jgi:septal ring-binding cell division protein DamX
MDGSHTVIDSVDPAASFRLGLNYELGEGVKQDSKQAFEWYCNGALQRHGDSQLKVALMLLEGRGTSKDIPKGMHWLNRAANSNNHDAQLALGILLVDTDPVRSAVLFKRSAAAGNLYANHRLAELHYYGMGVPQDFAKAQELSELGVAAGFDKSRELLTRIRVRQQVASNTPTPNLTVVKSPAVETSPTIESKGVIDVVAADVPTETPVIKSADAISGSSAAETEKSNNVLKSLLSVFPSLAGLSSTDKPKDQPPVEVTTSQAIPQLDEPDIVVSAVEGSAAVEVVEVESELKPEPEPLELGKSLQDQLVEAAAAEEEALKKETPVVKEQRVELEPVDADQYRRGVDWISQQPDMRYAIQLVQASQVDGILKYIRKYGLEDKSYYIHALQDGEYRYILLYGDYPNNKTSKAVAKTLPDGVQKSGYWIRTFGDLRRSYVISR